jgi:hypothetical protein
MPMAPLERTIDVLDVGRLRRRGRPKISWPVIMMRAYGLVARDNPVLRRIYVPLPKQHYYEHPESVCLLTISRQINGHECLLFARFTQPENRSLVQLQQKFDDYRRLPLEQIKQLRHQMRFARMPWFVRKAGWSLMTGWMPRARAKLMGTFGMSLSGLRDTHGSFHLGPCTSILGYDQICSNGSARLTLTFDHRVLDGKPAADVLESLRRVLHTQIRAELQGLVVPPQSSVGNQLTAPPIAGQSGDKRAHNRLRLYAADSIDHYDPESGAGAETTSDNQDAA